MSKASVSDVAANTTSVPDSFADVPLAVPDAAPVPEAGADVVPGADVELDELLHPASATASPAAAVPARIRISFAMFSPLE